MKRKGLNSFV